MGTDVTVSFAGHALTFPSLYLLIGCLIALGLAGFIVAMVSARRIEHKTTEATDILVMQLERIGDALDRLVAQSASARPAQEPARQKDWLVAEWPNPGRATPPARVIPEGSAIERAAQKPLSDRSSVDRSSVDRSSVPQPAASSAAKEKKPEEQTIESSLSEPARSILFSMLGR